MRDKTPRALGGPMSFGLARSRVRDYPPAVNNMDSKTPRCVLIVEDDDDSREMLGELVSAFGHRPVQAANAAEALAQARDERPDLALIDIGLPEVDGCELARLLRLAMVEDPELHTRLVALTGYSDGAMRESAGAAGGWGQGSGRVSRGEGLTYHAADEGDVQERCGR